MVELNYVLRDCLSSSILWNCALCLTFSILYSWLVRELLTREIMRRSHGAQQPRSEIHFSKKKHFAKSEISTHQHATTAP
jgi:hypothetical protein